MTAQSWTRGPLAPSPQENRSQASDGAWVNSQSMRGQPTLNWDLGTART